MFGSNFSRIIASAIIIGWAALNIFPINDIPFGDFLRKQETAKVTEFHEYLARADALVEKNESPSLYVALVEMGKLEQVDFSEYFPGLNLADVKSLEKRNEILLRHLLKESQGNIKLGLDLKGGVAFTLKVDDSALTGKSSYEKKQQLGKAIDIMSRRVDGLGVAEPIIRARDDSRIEVQLPGLTTQENPDVLDSLKKPAKLSFHLIHRTMSPRNTPQGQEPVGYVRMVSKSTNPQTNEVIETPVFVKRIPEMGGNMIKRAAATQNQYGGFEIHFNLTGDGGRRFGEITEKIVGLNKSTGTIGQLAIVLDNELYSAPSVRNPIYGGSAMIEGSFTQREAIELANVLNNPLEFAMELEEMYEVGPTLADDARTSSVNAALLGAGLVVLFMLVYYLSAGVVAVLSIFANLVIVLGVLASLESTLTLPGVAALVLTIGMAVDSNILIFERIREELNHGKNLHNAILSGYDKAFSTIVDANITTFLTAIILIFLGTGPVKGFGVTLSIGIGATLFCALVVSRFLLELLVNSRLVKKMLVFSLFKESTFDFHSVRKPAFIVSWAIVAAGVIALIAHRDHIYGIDFVGGDEVTITFAEKIGMNDIYDVADIENLGEIIPSYQTLLGSADGTEILKIQTEQGRGQEVFSALENAFPQAELEVIGETTIGASVSESIKTNALLALGVALLGILLYVALRFEWGYGIGAVVSTIHDVLLSIGIFVILDGQFSAPMVAAVLMIVGYSINDTIVVFDRIREELELNPTSSLKSIINHAINKTLSRTLLTSATTLMAAIALYIFGAGVVNDFALVFIIGILTGTFSSIFIASPVFYWWHKGDRKHVETGEMKPKYEWDA